MNYANIHEVVGWISSEIKCYRRKMHTAEEALDDIENTIKRYIEEKDKEIEQLKELICD